jgi:hypothetical protein
VIYRPFTFTHPGFGRFGRYRFVRENANPVATAAAHLANDRPPHGLNLPAGDPTGLGGLQAKITLHQLGTALSHAPHAATELLAVFHAFWH